jgi:hypothetical protein
VNAADAPAQIVSEEVLIEIVGTTVGVTATLNAVEVTVAGDAQADEEVKVQVIADAAVIDGRISTLLLVPAATPLTFQEKVGLKPGSVTCATKVSAAPEQIVAVPVTCTVGV